MKLKTVLFFIVLISVLPFFSGVSLIKAKTTLSSSEVDKMFSGSNVDTNTLIIKYKGEDTPTLYNLSDKYSFTQESFTEEEKLAALKKDFKILSANPNIEIVQPNYIYTFTDWEVTDTYANPTTYNGNYYWYYDKVDLPKAWKTLGCASSETCGGSSDVIVAVIDSGVAFENYDDTLGVTGVNFPQSPAFQNINLFENADEIPNNGLDDDCNGYVDDYNGVDIYAASLLYNPTCDLNNTPILVDNFYKKVGHPIDTYGHGTYVTSLITSNNNYAGSISPAFNVSLMPIAANNHFQNYFTSASLIYALNYAIDNKANVINLSLHSESRDEVVEAEIQKAIQNGITVVAAAGNDSSTIPGFPSSIPAVITVGAVDQFGLRTAYTNYGDSVDVMAYVGDGPAEPLGAVYQSTYTCFDQCTGNSFANGFSYQYQVGTSFAAPQVSALAALIISINPGITPDEVSKIITSSSSNNGIFSQDTSYGIINFNDALLVTTTDVYQFWDNNSRIYFYTTSDTEKDFIINNPLINTIYIYSGVAYKAFLSHGTGTVPVYRFFNKRTGVHFFTVDEGEKNDVLKLNDYIYEGIKYYVYATSQADSLAVYRFFNNTTGIHTYTTEEITKQVLLEQPNFSYEGVKYYVLKP